MSSKGRSGQGVVDAVYPPPKRAESGTASASLGERKNSGKPRWSLLPLDALSAIVDVMEFGAKKYSPRNWEKGLKYSETYDSMMRHLFAWWQCGEEVDPESGLHHLSHVAWNALVLLAFEKRGGLNATGTEKLDDRPEPVANINIHRVD